MVSRLIRITRLCSIMRFFTAVIAVFFRCKINCNIFSYTQSIDHGYRLSKGGSNKYPLSMF